MTFSEGELGAAIGRVASFSCTHGFHDSCSGMTDEVVIEEVLCWCRCHGRVIGDRNNLTPIRPEQAEAMCRLLIDSGDMTPMAHQQLRKLWTDSETTT